MRTPLAIALLALALAGTASSQELTYLDRIVDSGVLNGVWTVIVSPDGAFVYSASFATDSIGVYSRNPSTGSLTFQSVLTDGVGAVDGLADVSSIVLSADGSRLYSAAGFDDALMVWSRNAQTGALTPLQTLFDDVGGVDGLNGAVQLALSPDGASLYVTGRLDFSVSAFDVAADGTLSFVRKRNQDLGVYDVGQSYGVAVSPDGSTVYVANMSANPNRLVLFDRNAGSSDIEYSGTTILSTPQQPVGGAIYLVASPDGADLYVAANFDDAISIFEIGAGGELTPHGFVPDGASGDPQGLVLNASGTRLYVATSSPGAVTVFERTPSTGALSLLEVQSGTVAPGVFIGNGGELALSPDGAHLYVPDGSGQILVFGVAAPEPALAWTSGTALVALGWVARRSRA